MAVLAISALGAAAGAAIGGTFLGVTAASWGWMAGSMLGNALFAKDTEGPRLGDLRVTGSEYGQPVPWVAGSPRVAGQIIWASQKRETATSESAKGGPEVTTYSYDCDLVILLTENEIAGVSRIWLNSELVYGNGSTKAGIWSNITVYTGAEDQMPDPTYEAAVGAGNAPAYRGRGYVVIQGLQLGGSGQIPNLTFEVNTNDLIEVQTWPLTFAGPYDIVRQQNESFPPVTSATYYDQSGVIWGGSRSIVFDESQEWIDAGGPTSYPHGASIFPIGSQVEIEHTVTVVPGRLTRVFFVFDDIIRSSDGEAYTANVNGAKIGGGGIPWTFLTSFHAFYEFTPTTSAVSVFFRVNDNSTTNQFAGFGISQFHFEPNPLTGLEDLPTAINALMTRAGYSGIDYETSDLDISDQKPLRGLALGQVTATRGPLESLQTAWFFEASKSDKIYIRPRAETAVATIPWGDLGCAADTATGEDALSLVLANDLEVPAQVALSYPSMEQDYQTATEHSDRIFSGQESTQTVQLGIGMTAAEAKGVADAIVFDLAASQTKATLRVPLKYAYVEPGDIVNAVNFDGRTYRLRVQTKRDTLTIIELECVLDDVGALQSAGITDGDYISVTEPVTVEQTEFEALDIPILRDADNSPGYYMAVGPVITNPDNYEWKGAQVVRSWNGTDYAELFQTTGAGVLGTCSNTLGNWTGGNVYDETNALTVVTTGGELASRTREAMQLDGTLNVAAIGSQANGWEIIRFRNATLTTENTYVLTGLHRGFRGTEWAMASHGSGEQFVLLDSALRRVSAQTSQIGLERFIKAATFGLRLADVTEETFTDTGIALKPFAPANPVALADGADVVVTWQRRTRVSYVYGGATPSVPVGESVESYRVRIFDGSTLVRTEVVLSPEYTYAAADIASDGFASSDTITFEICQISEIVGAGYPAECEGIAP